MAKASMIRRQVDVDEEMDSRLRLLAAQSKCAVTEMIRRLVNEEWDRRNRGK